MPTFTYDAKDFFSLLGKHVSEEALQELLSKVKAELNEYGDTLTVEFNDTNLPWVWSVEGLTTMLQGVLGLEKGLPDVVVKKGKDSVAVDTIAERPYLAAFKAKGHMTQALLEQLIQLQEKLCESYGKKREKVAVGLYPAEGITFPLHYTLVSPTTEMIPLDGSRMMLSTILEKHPKGKTYASLLKNMKKYPVLQDASQQLLSFIPIINAESTGRVIAATRELFFEATGTDKKAVELVATIFAFALSRRNFTIESLQINYAKEYTVTPDFTPREVVLDMTLVESMLNSGISEPTAKACLSKMRYQAGSKILAPAMRQDIMHPVDVVEDVAIAFGYENIKPLPLTAYTQGSTFPEQIFYDDIRALLVGAGYQEIFSNMLTSKELMKKLSNTAKLVEVTECYSSSYAVLRNSLSPIVIDFLASNKHVEYPQKVFEEGIVTTHDGDEQHLAFACTEAGVTLTSMRQVLDFVFEGLGKTYAVQSSDLPWYIPGRSAKIIVQNRVVGHFGEVHPQIIADFGLGLPVALAELNLSLVWSSYS